MKVHVIYKGNWIGSYGAADCICWICSQWTQGIQIVKGINK